MESIPPPAAKYREIVLVAIALAGLMLLQMALTGAFALIPRHLWLDEVLTSLITSDPNLAHAMRSLAAGVDTSPPTLFLLMRAFSLPFGGVSDSTLHLFSLVSVWLALVGLYASLRCAVAPLTAAMGVLMVWAHPLVIRHAFEARSYGPLLALTVWMFYLLQIRKTSRYRFVIAAFVAIVAALLCTIHYFGIFSLIIVIAFDFFFDARAMRQKLRDVWPVVFGLLALVCCLPFFFEQRRAVTVATWVDPLNWPQAIKFGAELFPFTPLCIAVATFGISLPLNIFLRRPMDWREDLAQSRRMMGLVGLIVLPILLIVLSIALQPTLVARYAIPAVLAMGVIAALLVSRAHWTLASAACVALIVSGTYDLSRHTQTWTGPRNFTHNLDRLVLDLRDRTGDRPILFNLRQFLYPIWHTAPDLAARSYYWDFEQTSERRESNFHLFERDLARAVHRAYGGPGLMQEEKFASIGPFFLVTDKKPDAIEQALPAFRVQRVAASIYALTPK